MAAGANKVINIFDRALDSAEKLDKTGTVSRLLVVLGLICKFVLFSCIFAHMHIFAIIWRILKCYISKYNVICQCLLSIGYINVPITAIILSYFFLFDDPSNYSTAIFWISWGLSVMIMYYINLCDKKVKINSDTLLIFGLSKKNLEKVDDNSQTLQFLWIVALVSFAPAIILGFFSEYIYEAFFETKTKLLRCIDSGEAQGSYVIPLEDSSNIVVAYCKLSTTSVNWINVLINFSACVLLAWGLIRFVAETILNADRNRNLTPGFAEKITFIDSLAVGDTNPDVIRVGSHSISLNKKNENTNNGDNNNNK